MLISRICVCARLSARLHSFVGYFKLVGNKITLNDLYMYPDGGFFMLFKS